MYTAYTTYIINYVIYMMFISYNELCCNSRWRILFWPTRMAAGGKWRTRCSTHLPGKVRKQINTPFYASDFTY